MKLNESKLLKINEIFKSIQGESSYAGLPCVFIRLSGCNLRCSYCDTTYAYDEGTDTSIGEIIKRTDSLAPYLIEVTGGEPLLQPNTPALIDELVEYLKNKFNDCRNAISPMVLIETSGSVPIRDINGEAAIIMDVKTPSSGSSHLMITDNFNHLKIIDEVKFVIGDEADYEYSKKIIHDNFLYERCSILFSCVFNKMRPDRLVELMLKDKITARFQLQMHKHIWPVDKRGV